MAAVVAIKDRDLDINTHNSESRLKIFKSSTYELSLVIEYFIYSPFFKQAVFKNLSYPLKSNLNLLSLVITTSINSRVFVSIPSPSFVSLTHYCLLKKHIW